MASGALVENRFVASAAISSDWGRRFFFFRGGGGEGVCLTALEFLVTATTATTRCCDSERRDRGEHHNRLSSSAAQCPVGGTNVVADETVLGSGFGPIGEPRRGGGSGVTSEQFAVAVFPVVGLAFDPGLEGEGRRGGRPRCGRVAARR